MKRILISIYLVLLTGISVAQVCDDKDIRTDPMNTYTTPGVTSPRNPEKPTAVNNLNWRLDPNVTVKFPFSIGGGAIKELVSPWHVNDPAMSYYDLAKGTNSNYYPADGWEIFKVNLGRLNDNVTLRKVVPVVPYIILYNKFEGKLRLFGYLDRVNDYKSMAIELVYDSPDATNHLNYSAFLSLHGQTAQALDKKTKIINVTSVAQYSNNNAFFFWTDFPVAYDPCVCNLKSNLRINFRALQESKVDLTGTIIGSLKPVVGSDMGKPVLKILKAATTVTSLPTSILTGNFSNFFDAISSLADLTNMSSDMQQGITIVKDMYRLGKELNEISLTDKEKVGETLSKLSTFYSTAFKTGGGSSNIIHATGNFTGDVKTEVPFNGSTIPFSTPGSKDSHLNPEENTNRDVDAYGNVLPEYPAYNQILGTFALLKTPQINVGTKVLYLAPYHPLSNYGHHVKRISFNIPKTKSSTVLNDILYAFNPIMKMNPQTTKIKVAIVAREHLGWEPNPGGFAEMKNLESALAEYPKFDKVSCCEDYYYGESYQKVVNKYYNVFFSEPTAFEFQTKLVPLEYIYDLNGFIDIVRESEQGTTESLDDNMEFWLKFFVEFESHETNRFGLPNRSTLVFTYPLDQVISYDQEFATTDIEPILQQPRPLIPAQSLNNVNLFCNAQLSNAFYRAKEKELTVSKPTGKTGLENIKPETSDLNSRIFFKVAPNPANDQVAISYTLPKESTVRIKVYNLLMQEIKVPFLTINQAKGNHLVKLNTQGMQTGTYIIQLYANGQMSSQKVLIVK